MSSIVKTKPRINICVAITSTAAGILAWNGCRYIYSTYHDSVSGPMLIGLLSAILFITAFLIVGAGSMLTGSFDRESPLYENFGSLVKYFLAGLLGIFLLSMMLEFLYECNPSIRLLDPTSYIFVIDQSGSMSGNDPDGMRYEAIPEIMKEEEQGFPYMVYTFSNNTEIARDMGPMDEEYEEIPVVADGGTAIRGTILRILRDYKEGKWDGGANPKVIFLTDGAATDLSNGLFWFRGNVPEFNAALEEYKTLGITISTVGLGNVDREVMSRMAEMTGGVFVNIQDAKDLATAMKTAATSYAERDLFSIRYMRRFGLVYGMLRILFFSIIGTLTGSLLLFAYMEDTSILMIVVSSVLAAAAGSTLFELGIQTGVSQRLLWCLLWMLFAMTPGYIYPKAKQATNNGPYVVREQEHYLHNK